MFSVLGSIPDLSRLTKLRLALLQLNHLSGSLPSMEELSSLEAVVMFGNSLGGRIKLPPQHLDTVLLHRNFLSCQIEGEHVTTPCTNNVLLGRQLQRVGCGF